MNDQEKLEQTQTLEHLFGKRGVTELKRPVIDLPRLLRQWEAESVRGNQITGSHSELSGLDDNPVQGLVGST